MTFPAAPFVMSPQQRPCRILHVANFGYKPTKVFVHSTAAKLSNGWTRAGHHVVNFSDRDVARWRSFLGVKPMGKAATNHLLTKLCHDIRPDIIAFGHADIITHDTLARIRDELPQVKMLQWNVDWWVDDADAPAGDVSSRNNKKKISAKRDMLDATFITTAGKALGEIAQKNHVAAFLPNPVDPSLEHGHNFARSDLPDDVFFAVSAATDRRHTCGQWHDMATLCATLADSIPTARCAFYGINRPQALGPAYEQALHAAKIGLNINRRNDAYLYSSDRLGHMAGNGLAICMDRATGYNDIFSDDEMAFYSSIDELKEQLQRLTRDDQARRTLAEKGWQRYSMLFNSTLIAQYMIDVVRGTHDPRRYCWPTTSA